MAHADAFPEAAMQELAAEAAEWLAASGLPTTDTTIARTPLLVWDLEATTSLAEAATPSGEWHHRILHAGHAIAFARSRLVGTHAELVELAQSPLVELLEDALNLLRADARDSTVLRLLRIQRNHTTCLWRHNPDSGDSVITLQSPSWPPHQRVDEATFFQMVRVLRGPGLVHSPSEQRRECGYLWDRKSWQRSRTRPVRQPASDI